MNFKRYLCKAGITLSIQSIVNVSKIRSNIQKEYKLMKKVFSLSLSIAFLILLVTSCDSFDSNNSSEFSSDNNSQISQTISEFQIGDYLLLGSYYDEPIIWRCVDIDGNGPLMLADKILCLKAFDVPGNHTYLDGTPQNEQDDKARTLYGSNLWETSNLRAWLNSASAAGEVSWPDGCSPTEDKFYNGSNAYADEKGFLAEGNFSSNEIGAIKKVVQKSLLSDLDNEILGDSGTTVYNWQPQINEVVSNYLFAFSHDVEDFIFLLDVNQVNRVWMNGDVLGEDYYIGKPTEKAVVNDEIKSEGFTVDNYWYYWLRTPLPSGANVLKVYTDGRINDFGAGSNQMGVRPAFYFALDSLEGLIGDGSVEAPYSLG